METQLRIGDLARQVEVAPSLVRYYEEIGLLPPAVRTKSGYRVYNQADVERLRFIQRAKDLDFSLEEIKEILGLRERGEAPCAYVISQIEAKIEEVDRKMAALSRLKAELVQLQGEATRLPLAEIEAKSCVCHLIENQQFTTLDKIIIPRE
ncbi:MAG: heavy metal-responsive transcriptional regulator [Anaerolineae bacterium]|nr:heavy metal-responsive transcriptional regulator [Anaerolineae bacterium]